MDPTGPPGSRRRLSVRDVVLDPGGERRSRETTDALLPSLMTNSSATACFGFSGLTCHTLHGPCLRFRPRVTTTPARLGTERSATTFLGQDLHLLVIVS